MYHNAKRRQKAPFCIITHLPCIDFPFDNFIRYDIMEESDFVWKINEIVLIFY